MGAPAHGPWVAALDPGLDGGEGHAPNRCLAKGTTKAFGEAEDLGFAVAEPFEEVTGLGLPTALGLAMLAQHDPHGVAEQPHRSGRPLRRDAVQAAVPHGRFATPLVATEPATPPGGGSARWPRYT